MLAGAWLKHSWTVLYGILPHKNNLPRLPRFPCVSRRRLIQTFGFKTSRRNTAKPGRSNLCVGHTDHRFVRGQFRQSTGIDAVDFQEIGGGLHASTFIAVKVGLAFSDME